MGSRWDGDKRGRGVADARQLIPGANELVVAFGEDGWVAEEPELHLLPHIEAWCETDRRLALIDAHTDGQGAYIVEVEWHGPIGSVREVRAAVFALLGRFAESATYVRQRWLESGAGLRYEIGTGELAPDTRFAPHGHALVINVGGEEVVSRK